jgi:hypothetical protein
MEDNLQYILGQMNGQLTGICREIREIKDAMKCKSQDCEECKDGIDKRFGKNEKAISGLQDIETGETAVSSWWDSTITKIAVIVGIALGVVGFLWDVLH